MGFLESFGYLRFCGIPENGEANPLSTSDWLDFDKSHVWHPYSSLIDPVAPLPIASARGVRLKLEDGPELIDGMSSWWAAIHGYNHPVLNQAITDQLGKMAHVMFGGLTHRSAVSLAALLVDITPELLDRVFFVDSGSVAVEVAIKMAIQYWYAAKKPDKQKLLTIERGYHGDTFGAMGVCDPQNGMHSMFSHVLPGHFFAEAPQARTDEEWSEEDIRGFRDILGAHHEEIAAVILEPLVQGAGGMRFYSGEFLRQARALCDHFSVLLIFDEIATGFGRTGDLFACQKAGVVPDILCLGKALTGGYLSLAATLSTEAVARTICNGQPGLFMHGPTFMGNPLACAVAKASVELLLQSPYQRRVRAIEAHFERELLPLNSLRCVADARVLGAIGVVEFTKPVHVAAVQRECVERGVWVRPFGNLLYLMPPYVIGEEDLGTLTDAVIYVAEKAERDRNLFV